LVNTRSSSLGRGPPKRILYVAPDLTTVAKPYPSGVVILELAINEKGVVVSSCLLRGIRADFDKAAQLATLGWRFEPKVVEGKPIGVVMTVTVNTPHREG
jgi:TonB family protein